MSQGLRLLQQYLNEMCKLSYDANYKRCLGERNKEGRRERALEKANTFSLPGAKNLSAFLVSIALTINCCSGRKRRLPGKIMSLEVEEPQDR